MPYLKHFAADESMHIVQVFLQETCKNTMIDNLQDLTSNPSRFIFLHSFHTTKEPSKELTRETRRSLSNRKQYSNCEIHQLVI